MSFALSLVASMTIGVAFVLSLMVTVYEKRKPEYALGRLFLMKDETAKALKAMVIGTFIFAAGRITALCYSLNLISQSVYFASTIVTGEAFAVCLIYAFYKMSRIMKPTVHKEVNPLKNQRLMSLPNP